MKASDEKEFQVSLDTLITALPKILEMASKESISNLVIVMMFLVALWRITRQHEDLVRIHMKGCNESLQHNTDAVATNTTQTTRVVDALNQIALRMPNFGCSQHQEQKIQHQVHDAVKKSEAKGDC